MVGIDNFDSLLYGRAHKERNLADVAAATGAAPAFIEADVRDVAALVGVLRPDSVVVHLAARAGVRPSIADPLGYSEYNVSATAAVAEACRRVGTTRLVFGSSSSVYGDDTPVPFREDATAMSPVSPYAATKRAAELLLSSVATLWGIRCASLRFFTVYGPRQRPDLAIRSFAQKMIAGETLTLFGDGSQSRDYTYCDDIVDGVVAAIDWTATAAPGVEILNLGGSHPHPLSTVIGELSRALGIEPVIRWAPMQPGDVQQTFADVSKSARVLGYAPRIAFADGIDRFVDWLRQPPRG